MAPVQIFIGSPDLLKNGQFDCRLDGVADYVSVYRQIVQAIYSGAPLRVAVLDKVAAFWLRKLPERYGRSSVVIEELTLRKVLSRQWGVPIPDWVREQDLADAGLSSVSISAAPGTSFEDFLLGVFFSPFLARPTFAAQLIGELARTYDADQWSKSLQVVLLGEILSHRLQQWKEAARSDGEKMLLAWLEKSPKDLIESLGLLKAVAGYPPEIGARVFGETYPALAALELDLTAIRMPDLRGSKAEGYIRVRLEELTRLGPAEGVAGLLEEASGCLTIEFQIFQRLLAAGGAAASEELIRRARQVFAPLGRQPNIRQALADLDLMIEKPDPGDPDPGWSEDEWIVWAINRYLPYRYWLENTGRLDDRIGDIAEVYAKWLVDGYSERRLGSDRMAWRAMPAMQDRIRHHPGPTLVVILDNFNSKYLVDLRADMQTEGFFLDHLEYRFSMLPSCTEISKRCILAGDSEPFEGDYGKLVESTWRGRLGPRICYLPHVGALRGVTAREHDVYLLNYLPLDIALHEDEQQTGISQSQAIRSHLSALSADIRAFAERIGAEQDLLVVMVADHGSTRIPAETANVIQEKFYKTRVTDIHDRYLPISDDELKKLPQNVEGECFILRKGLYELPENYLIARRLFRFGETTEYAAVHGGATPEETIVPLAVFTPIVLAPKPLEIRLIDKQLRSGSLNRLAVEITNTNTYGVEEVLIDALNPEIDAKPIEVPEIEMLSSCQKTLDARLRRIKGGEGQMILQLRVRYQFLGQPHDQSAEFPVSIQTTMRTAVDDLLV